MTVAWGRQQESWVVDRGRLDGNPYEAEVWAKLDDYLVLNFVHESGGYLPIAACAIDTGGTNTHDVYAFCRKRANWRVYAIQGRHKPGGPVVGRGALQDINESGRVVKRGVKLWGVGVLTAKDLLANRLQIERVGPGYINLSTKVLTDDHFAELTSEKRVAKRSRGKKQMFWENPKGARNETWDLLVYNLFCAQMLNLHTAPERYWTRQEEKLAQTAKALAEVSAANPVEKRDTPLPTPGPSRQRFVPTGAVVR
jgi:phage terminase large subunit GpA-like protein